MNRDEATRQYEPVPFRTGQLSLFAPTFQDACEELGITDEETERWQSEGWLSIGADASQVLTDQDLVELRFVAGYSPVAAYQAAAAGASVPKEV